MSDSARFRRRPSARGLLFLLGCAGLAVAPGTDAASAESGKAADAPIAVGWIGAQTGGTARWGAKQAVDLAVSEINAAGGIAGHPVQLIAEDARCDPKTAVSAFQKLSRADGVKYILGGHCSPETLAFAGIANSFGIVTIASISSSPKITPLGPYVFRLTPVSTKIAQVLAPYLVNIRHIRSLFIIHELTDYVVPPAEALAKEVEQLGGAPATVLTYNPGETDFRPLLSKVLAAYRSNGAESSPSVALYVGTQAPDTMTLIHRQLAQLGGTGMPVFGNEQVSGALHSATEAADRAVLERTIFGEPFCNLHEGKARTFADSYRSAYRVGELPFGCYTAEPYDAMKLLATALASCAPKNFAPECVQKTLAATRGYEGASGEITFDENGDVTRPYRLREIRGGQVVDLQ